MRAYSKLTVALVVGMTAVAAVAPTASAAETGVECGAFHDYLAPDAGTMTPGTITFGLHGTPETIAADATLDPPVASNLPGLAGGTPTCLTVVRDAGVITSLVFAASGPISGEVEFVPDLLGSGFDAYVIADRLFTPVDIIADNPGLAALIPTAAATGSALVIHFQIDVTSGVPTGFDAATGFSGPVALDPGGDVLVGAARLADAVIDPDSRAAFEEAAALGVDATVVVSGIGTLDQSSPGGVAMAITLAVSFTAPAAPEPSPGAPVPPPAPLPNTAVQASSDSGGPIWLLPAALLLVVGAGRALRARAARRLS